MTIETLIQQLMNALSLGSIYALLALGLAVVYSVLGLLNFAFGEIVTAAGYTLVLLVETGVPLWLAALAGLVAGVIVSLLTELVAFRPLRRAPAYAVIFTSFAVSLIIQSLVRTVISPRPQGVAMPHWVDAVVTLGAIRFPLLSVVTIVIAIAAMLALSAVLGRSKHGVAMRAAAEDFETTRLMGASANNLIRLAFLISGVLAGVAGLLWIARTGSATPEMGFNPLLHAFVAVILGGLGNLRGAVIGGFALAIIEVLLQVLLPQTLVPYVQALTFTVVVIVLYARPHGFTKAVEGRLA
jgi:branched-chain amino acid transport system permease protein